MPLSSLVHHSAFPLDDTDQTEESLDEDDSLTNETCSLQSSSNDTASDLPGHGRMLGLLYSHWGRALEAATGRVETGGRSGSKAAGSRSQYVVFEGIGSSADTEPDETDPTEESLCEDDEFTDIICSQQSSSNDTASNLSGPGRMLGLLYARWGRALESAIGHVAQKSGLGPTAVASRIRRVELKWVIKCETDAEGRIRRVDHWTVKDGSDAKLHSDCRKLTRYVTAEIWETRFEALAQIIQAVTANPRLRAFFNTPLFLLDLRAATQTSSIPGHGSACWEDELVKHQVTKALAKQALLVVEDNPLNDIIEDFLQKLSIHGYYPVLEVDKCNQIVGELLEYCRNRHYSFKVGFLKTYAIEVTSNLAHSLQAQFKRHRKSADLHGAIELYRATLQLLPDNHAKYPSCLDGLANSLRSRFEQHGQTQTADIDEAIEHYRTVLKLLPEGHPDRSHSVNNLANSLQFRFEQHGQTQTADIDEAIKHYCTALKLLPEGHPDCSHSLNNLTNSLRVRFAGHRQFEDLEQLIKHRSPTLELYSDSHPILSFPFNDLANSLLTQFELYGQAVDLGGAIVCHDTALQLFPDNHFNCSLFLNNVVKSIETRFQQYGQAGNIDEVIEYYSTILQHCSC